MAHNYKKTQRAKAEKLIDEQSDTFYGDKGNGYYRGIQRKLILTDFNKNFYAPIRKSAIEYFNNNGVSWWGGKNPTGHVLSSQIACVNHLFALRKDKQAVLAILKSISGDFIDVFEIESDKFLPAYIQFEAVSKNGHLNERCSTRGSNCTSIDALIYAKHQDGTKWIIPIEWKYTEHYGNSNKAIEGCAKDPIKGKGKVRRDRYTKLINDSKQLKSEAHNHFCYYFEPFYQLMRQTLWAEQIIANKATETIKADNYLHIHVIPSDNGELLDKKYKCSGTDMITTWKGCLKDIDKYIIISPESLFARVDKGKYSDLFDYLRKRYW